MYADYKTPVRIDDDFNNYSMRVRFYEGDYVLNPETQELEYKRTALLKTVRRRFFNKTLAECIWDLNVELATIPDHIPIPEQVNPL